jgi:hypothetical protein
MNLDPLLVTPRGTAWWLYLLYGIAAVLFAIVTCSRRATPSMR